MYMVTHSSCTYFFTSSCIYQFTYIGMYTIYIFFTYLWTSGFDVKYQMYVYFLNSATL